jgi:hypothetical protein
VVQIVECLPTKSEVRVDINAIGTIKIRAGNNSIQARHWWLTPVILATQEAKIRRIIV